MNIIGHIDPSAFACAPRMHHGEPTAMFPSSVGSRRRGLLALKACNWGAAKKSAPTARDYVQDGLLFNWDAIDNAGYGIHDEKPTKWVDLSGSGLDIPLSSRSDSWSFGADEFTCEVRDNTLYRQHPQTEVLDGSVSTTVEWVESISPGYDGYSIEYPLSLNGYSRSAQAGGYSNWVAGGDPYMWRVGLRSDWRGNIWVKFGENFNDGARFHYASTIEIGEDGDTCTCIQYVNGVEVKKEVLAGVSIQAPNIGFIMFGDPRVHLSAIRYYTRVLSPAEVAANYAVDKARFGLA